MKKRKTKQQKVIDETIKHINGLLKTAQKAINEPTEDRYFIHHKLLEMISMVTIVLNGNGYSQTEQVIERIRQIADMVAPVPDSSMYH